MREKLVFLILAGAFAALAVESRYYHRGVVGEYPVAFIPIVVSALCVVACFVAMAANAGARGFSKGVFALAIVSGLAGLYFHTEFQPSRFLELLAGGNPTVVHADEGEGSEHGGREGQEAENEGEQKPPVLAPMSITGLAAIGFVSLLDEKGRKRK